MLGDASLFTDKALSNPFPVKWIKKYDDVYSGLEFHKTKDLINSINNQTVNLSRNIQEIDTSCGEELCRLMDEDWLQKEKESEQHRLLQQSLVKKPESFFELSESEEKEMIDSQRLWGIFLQRVEENLGPVVLATVIGSRRYNLQNAKSDLDLFVIVLYPLEDIVKLRAVEQTFKNPEFVRPDFTIHGVEYFADLLVDSDTKMFECLFLNDQTVYTQTEYWQELRRNRRHFFNVGIIQKYVSEVRGVKGLKKINRLLEQYEQVKGKQEDEQDISAKLYKCWYISLRCLLLANRLLYCWRNQSIEEYSIWFEPATPEHDYLLDIRNGRYSFAQLNSHTAYLLSYIETEISSAPLSSPITASPASIVSTLHQLAEGVVPTKAPKQLPQQKSNTVGATSLDEAKEMVKLWYRRMRIDEVTKRNILKFDLMKHIEQESDEAKKFVELLHKEFNTEVDGKLLLLANTACCSSTPSRTRTKPIYMGVYSSSLRSKIELFSNKPNTITNQKAKQQTPEASCDYTIYELERFCEGLLRSDLTLVINCLFRNSSPTEASGAEQYVVYEDALWTELRSMREQFFVSSLFHQLIGYLKYTAKASQSKPRQQQQAKQPPNKRRQQKATSSLRDDGLLLAILETTLLGVDKMMQLLQQEDEIKETTSESALPSLRCALQLSIDLVLKGSFEDETDESLTSQLKAIEELYSANGGLKDLVDRMLQSKVEEESLNRWFLKVRFSGYL
eukprot:TRINITY_DN10770_c0_g1_i1.p1 TRINITY_DN10770_c0_g1~~TRINITY_DN10770_c0_g1_i1.p1  ORF type:complete len:804 (-),score=186.41 TRINITY_DN10770_c0_g1_i1:2-2197(-)